MNVQQLERAYDQARSFAISQNAKFTQIAAEEHRQLGPGEKSAIAQAMKEADDLRARLSRAKEDQSMTTEIERLTGGMTGGRPASGPTSLHGGGASLGQQFIDSEAGQFLIRNRGKFPTGAWTSPTSELRAATLTEDAASGGDLVLVDTRPGILALPTRQLVVADLPAQGTTDSNVVAYMKETTFTNAANSVAEGAAKPESTLIFDAASDPVRKLAHWLPVTEEMVDPCLCSDNTMGHAHQKTTGEPVSGQQATSLVVRRRCNVLGQALVRSLKIFEFRLAGLSVNQH